VTELISGLKQFEHDLAVLVEKGGPDPRDYDLLNLCFRKIAAGVRNNLIPIGELFKMWRNLGEAFSTPRTLQGHVVAKPYGYDGDFELLDKIYTRWISPDPKLANWDRFFHSQAATDAVRHRKEYFLSLVQRLLSNASRTRKFRLLNAGCGPARDIHDLWKILNPDAMILLDCVDLDPRAIDYARSLNKDFLSRTEFVCGNVLRFKPTEKYDLIWGAGIFDYLKERTFTMAVKRFLPMLRPGGWLVISNFSPNNPTRDYMDCGQWLLQYRTTKDLLKIAVAAGVPESQVSVESDAAGVVNYLHIPRMETTLGGSL